MFNIIALIIFFISILGICIIIASKVPILATLPLQTNKKSKIVERLRERVKNNGTLKKISVEILLQKILSKIRILTLRAESQISHWLSRLRKKSVEKKNNFSDDYWKKLKGE